MAKDKSKKLTLRQQRFVDAYLLDPNATKAAIAAGYSKRAAHSCGPRLLENAGVKEALAKAAEKAARAADVTVTEVLQGLRKEAHGEGLDTTSAARIQAWGLLGKTLKMFTDKVELSGRLTLEELVRESMQEGGQ